MSSRRSARSGLSGGHPVSGNPLAVAAGLATLELLDRAAYVDLDRQGGEARRGDRAAFASTDVPVQVPQVGPLLGFFFADESRGRQRRAQRHRPRPDHFAPLFHALSAHGVALAPGPYEIMFPSLAHTDEVLDRTIDAFHTAAASL